jgi:putative aminopeptidase FrvX
MKKLDFLKKYINTPSPSGYEMKLGGQQVWIDYVKSFVDNVEVSNYGNAYAHYQKFDKSLKTVVLDAHCDEIGFFVFDITPLGFIKIGTLGGSDITIAPSSRVNIWVDKDNPVVGVFGHPAIHVHQRKFESKKENCFIDIGVSTKEEVLELGITVGTPITMVDGFMKLGPYYCGRALDDKIGGFITSQVLRKLHKQEVDLPFNLIVVNAVQEEVGLHGAQMAASDLKPDLAIAIDVCHDTTSPAYNPNLQGSITAGEGTVIMSAPSIQNNVFEKLVSLAKDNDIKYQLTASGGHSGTNADSYAFPNGTPTGLVKLGMRYMHTTVETVHKDDVQACIDLLYNFVIDEDANKSFKH